jgi:uncharacterized protein (DUF433 family)
MEKLTDKITVNEKVCNGKPTIRGKRITVATILEFLQAGESVEEILKQYPTLELEDIDACMQFAKKLGGSVIDLNDEQYEDIALGNLMDSVKTNEIVSKDIIL